MAPTGSSTAPEAISHPRARRARAMRRTYLALLGAFLILGLLNVFGSTTSSVSAQSNGYSLRVDYPSATRSSLPVKWEVVVTHAGGFADPVRIAVPLDYWNLFDFNNLFPTPDSMRNEGEALVMVFPPPAGDRLDVLLDARTQPGLRFGMDGTTAIIGRDDRPLVEVSFHTRVAP